jgi:hypothetical protein
VRVKLTLGSGSPLIQEGILTPSATKIRGPSWLSGTGSTGERSKDQVVEALTAIVRDHPPYGRWANIRVGADGTPEAADVRAEVARGRVLVIVQLPPEAAAAR